MENFKNTRKYEGITKIYPDPYHQEKTKVNILGILILLQPQSFPDIL